MTSIFLSINHSQKHSFWIHFVPCHDSFSINSRKGDRRLRGCSWWVLVHCRSHRITESLGDVAKTVTNQRWNPISQRNPGLPCFSGLQIPAWGQEGKRFRKKGDCLAAVMAYLVIPQHLQDPESTLHRKKRYKKLLLGLHWKGEKFWTL